MLPEAPLRIDDVLEEPSPVAAWVAEGPPDQAIAPAARMETFTVDAGRRWSFGVHAGILNPRRRDVNP
jgi:hypothetical protein